MRSRDVPPVPGEPQRTTGRESVRLPMPGQELAQEPEPTPKQEPEPLRKQVPMREREQLPMPVPVPVPPEQLPVPEPEQLLEPEQPPV